MASHKVVFLFDVDNTLLNNDRVAAGRASGMVAYAAQTRGMMSTEEQK